MKTEYLVLVIILGCGMILSVRAGKLDRKGAITGGLAGILIFMGAGFTGIAMTAAFFLLGTAATAWRTELKEAHGVAEKDKGRRTAGQVIANAGLPALVGFLSWLHPEKAGVFRLMMAAGLASAAADTLSSELGNVYGRKFYNIMRMKKDQRGLNGVVSLEGTLFGVVGSCIIAAIYGIGITWSMHVVWIIIAGTVGNLSDSVLGATLERKGLLGNNIVNLLNTLAGALTALVLYFV